MVALRRNTGLLVGLALVGVTALPRPAFALQSLDVFIHSAANHNPDALEAHANLDQTDAQSEVALGKLLPGINAKGTYTRNEYEVTFTLPVSPTKVQSLVIQPSNQLDATATLAVPLIDVANYVRFASARTNLRGIEAQTLATTLHVQAQVTQYYYQLLANVALVDAAQHALDVAQANLQLTRDRLHAGRAAALDEARAEAEAERQQQQLVTAQLQVTLSARSLASLSGVEPDMSQVGTLQDDLAPEQSVEHFEHGDDHLPGVQAAVEARHALEQQSMAAKLTLIPSLNGAFTERFTNATGFAGGHNHYYLATLNLIWNFDLTTVGNIQVAEAQEQLGNARELRARLQAHDDIHNTWNMVQSNIARSRSARAQSKASADASAWAKDRYTAGVATQLDLLQAQRDAFQADANRIQADADLVNARAQLRYASGIQFDDFSQEKKQ